MTNDQYIDHELRLRMLEQLSKQVNSKMNTALMLILSGVLIPLILKYLET